MIKELFTYPHYKQFSECCSDIVSQVNLPQISVQESAAHQGWDCSSGGTFTKLLNGSRNMAVLHQLEKPFNRIAAALAGSAIDDFLQWFPVPLIRSRLLTLAPGASYYAHCDPSPRIHLPVTTNDSAFVVINQISYNLQNNGTVYFADTRLLHTATNHGSSPRTHFVAVLENKNIDMLLANCLN